MLFLSLMVVYGTVPGDANNSDDQPKPDGRWFCVRRQRWAARKQHKLQATWRTCIRTSSDVGGGGVRYQDKGSVIAAQADSVRLGRVPTARGYLHGARVEIAGKCAHEIDGKCGRHTDNVIRRKAVDVMIR